MKMNKRDSTNGMTNKELIIEDYTEQERESLSYSKRNTRIAGLLTKAEK